MKITDTPWRELAILARKVAENSVRRINDSRATRPDLRFPQIEYHAPDIADFEEAFERYFIEELAKIDEVAEIERYLEWVRKYGPASEARKLLDKLRELDSMITKRNDKPQ